MSNPRVKRKVKQNGKTRLNLRLPADLDTWVKSYAHKHDTTVTAMIIGFFRDLRSQAESDVQQF